MRNLFLHSEGGGLSSISAWEIQEIIARLPQEVDESIEAFVVDLFSGFGGTSYGYEEIEVDGQKVVKVIFCVNHDKVAIKCHMLNHPFALHAIEDMRTLNLDVLRAVVAHYRKIYPNAKLKLWASLECTNFSKAKGGLSRDPDSRTLANHLFRYIDAINPDYIMIENVVEFMAWGPVRIKAKRHIKEDLSKGIYANTELKMGVDKKTKLEAYWWQPVSYLNGTCWLEWCNRIKAYGYDAQWRKLNSADFGVEQTRDRLFGCFAKDGLPIVWPKATHSKDAKPDLFSDLLPWNGVKNVLDLTKVGESIFNRDINMNLPKKNRKDLCDNTMKRYYKGCIKIIAGGEKRYNALKEQYYKSNHPYQFVALYYGSGGQYKSIDEPNGTVPTHDRFSLFTAEQFIDEAYSASDGKSINQPSGTLLQVPKQSLMTMEPVIINTSYNNNGSSIHDPSPTITADRHHHYILNPSHGGHCTDINRPSPTVIARQDKAPLYLITATTGKFNIPVYDTDSEYTVKLKEFMAVMNFKNIYMRMFEIIELLQIQSLPKNYKMVGSKSDQKKFIGNAVASKVVTAMGSAFIPVWRELRRMAA
ncbi:DNA cytosine methyltransferase [Mucilaginibacter endophyticus]|uniref:DNA cytosine methyltransferase n=1 Tax=Mucilaginibacter endophyticus TaxID=2675003 RepID=UPI00137A64B3|nr:DNA cytosine methyltransferase [Mucilaginibacter endophyticus]